MFDSLSDKLHDVFRKLRGQSTLTDENIAEAVREIRLALIDADVNLEIATEFINAVKEKCIGQEVLKSVTPAQRSLKSSSPVISTAPKIAPGTGESSNETINPRSARINPATNELINNPERT